MLEDQQTEFESIEAISLKIDEIDELINLQLNEILHHPEFISMEAAWRGLHYLVNQGELGLKVKVKILNLGKRDLLKDFERSLEIENSAIYKKVFSEVYEDGWQHPFGLLVGAYEFDHHPQDVVILEKMSELSAEAHAPFIAGVSPSMFKRENFDELGEMAEIAAVFESPEFSRWNSFRNCFESRYVGLCLPRILLRARFDHYKNFKFKKTHDQRDVLWGNAAFAFAGCVVRAYSEKSWLGKMRGIGTDGEIEGVAALDAKIENKFPELTRLGFLTLLHDTSVNPYFFISQSVHKTPVYDSEPATNTARLHARLENIIAASRFAHYLMSLWRERAHLFNTRDDKKTLLNKWLWRYFPESDAFDADDPRCLLREFYADLTEVPGKPGRYKCILFIRPVYLLDDMTIAMRLVISLRSPFSDA